MNGPFPIGEREGQSLEFKSADALKKPFTISREVVAMLNAEGGEIWVGIRDQDDIATAFERISDADAAKKDLLNHFESVMDPKPDDRELKIHVVDAEPGTRVLRIHVRPAEHRNPYAYLKDGGRHYVLRLDHRVRAMTRDEIHGAQTRDETASADLQLRRDEILKQRQSLLWIGVRALSAPRIDVQAASIAELLTNPIASGNRRDGWSRWHGLGAPQFFNEGVRMGDVERGLVQLSEHGSIEFLLLLKSLTWPSSPPRELVPLGLLETVVSITRLASSLYGSLGPEHARTFLFDVVLTGISGWSLPAWPHGTFGYELKHEPPQGFASDVYVRGEPLLVAWDDLHENPDRVGFQLVRGIYQSVGLTEDRMPLQFDRKTERLILPG